MNSSFLSCFLHLCTYLCRFFQLSLTFSCSGEPSGNLTTLPKIIEFGVINDYSKSSAIHQLYPTKLYRDSKTTNNTQDDKTFNDFAEEFQPIRSAAAVAKHRIKDIANNENQ